MSLPSCTNLMMNLHLSTHTGFAGGHFVLLCQQRGKNLLSDLQSDLHVNSFPLKMIISQYRMFSSRFRMRCWSDGSDGSLGKILRRNIATHTAKRLMERAPALMRPYRQSVQTPPNPQLRPRPRRRAVGLWSAAGIEPGCSRASAGRSCRRGPVTATPWLRTSA